MKQPARCFSRLRRRRWVTHRPAEPCICPFVYATSTLSFSALNFITCSWWGVGALVLKPGRRCAHMPKQQGVHPRSRLEWMQVAPARPASPPPRSPAMCSVCAPRATTSPSAIYIVRPGLPSVVEEAQAKSARVGVLIGKQRASALSPRNTRSSAPQPRRAPAA
jgi:hypothetical protein